MKRITYYLTEREERNLANLHRAMLASMREKTATFEMSLNDVAKACFTLSLRDQLAAYGIKEEK